MSKHGTMHKSEQDYKKGSAVVARAHVQHVVEQVADAGCWLCFLDFRRRPRMAMDADILSTEGRS